MPQSRSNSPVGDRRDAWIFAWRPLNSPIVPKLIALTIVSAAFALLITSLRIRVVGPEKSAPRRAGLIFLRDDIQGRALTLRAREGGPFPSRFDLAEWSGMAALEAESFAAVAYRPPRYVPKLQELPNDLAIVSPKLAPAGERFFPIRKRPVMEPPSFLPVKLVPQLRPLSPMAAAAVPPNLPPFPDHIDRTFTVPSWRLMIRLNADGGVTECVSLEKGGEAAAQVIGSWFRKIAFKPAPEIPSRWLAFLLEFSNQPADGTISR